MTDNTVTVTLEAKECTVCGKPIWSSTMIRGKAKPYCSKCWYVSKRLEDLGAKYAK